LLDVQVNAVPSPAVIVGGLKETVQLGTPELTLTPPVHVLVEPELLATVRVQVWLAMGEKTVAPLDAEKVPLPRSPVQL
jgi:hypothetical protein